MSETGRTPPRWMESILEHLLPAHTRDEIVGDLREEYIDSVLPLRGRLRSNVWYARHILSFLPQALRESRTMGMLLLCTSILTMLSTIWLASMEMTLRHPGYGRRIAMDLCLAVSCFATIVVRRLTPPRTRSEMCLLGSGLLMILLGAMTFFDNAHSAHFEGFVFLISLLLMAQGMLMVLTLGRRGENGPGRLAN